MRGGKSGKTSKSIDSLKGLAMLGILLVHSRISFSGRYEILNCVINNGARGVQLMFVLNGYLIFKSLEHAFERGRTLKEWYKRKALRILPLYWIFTVLHLLIFGRGERFYLGPLKEVSWVNIICNVLCVHGFFPYYINSINVNWFVADLILWYLIAPFLYKHLNSLKKIITGMLLIVPLDYCLLMILQRFPLISNEAIWNDYISILCFLPELPVILLGCVIYWMERENKTAIMDIQMSRALFVFAFVTILFLIMGNNKFYLFSNIFSFALVFALIFITQLTNPIGLFCNTVLKIIGKHSYGIYLSHLFIISAVWKVMGNATEPLGNRKSVLIYLIICGCSLIVAIVVEKAYGYIVNLLKIRRE